MNRMYTPTGYIKTVWKDGPDELTDIGTYLLASLLMKAAKDGKIDGYPEMDRDEALTLIHAWKDGKIG